MTASPSRLRAMARQIEAAIRSMEREDADEPVGRGEVLVALAMRLSAEAWKGLLELLEAGE